MSPTKVLHGPVEIAGQVALSASALRDAGVDAISVAPEHPFGFDPAPNVQPPFGWEVPGLRGMASRARYAISVAQYAGAAEILHLHFGSSFLTYHYAGLPPLDTRGAKLLGKRIMPQFHGSEVRSPSREASRNPYYVPFAGETDARAANTVSQWAVLSDGHCVISDIGLEVHVAPFFEHVHLVPLATTAFSPPEHREKKQLTIAHAPSELGGKGTDSVRRAIERLLQSGAELAYVELTGTRHSDVINEIRNADIVIDQLRVGTYGRVSVEAMAAGKPCLVYMQDSLAGRFPERLPLVNVNPETLEAELQRLIESPSRMKQLGLAGYEYARREHSTSKLGEALLSAYERVGVDIETSSS